MATPVAAPSSQRPAPHHMGFDITRPFRYAFSGAKGLIGGFLDGLAQFGRKGFWAGAGFGLLATIATGGAAGFGYIALGAVAGVAAGGTLGAVTGGLRGTFSNISRSHRREKYAGELAERQTASRARVQRAPVQDFTHYDTLATRRNAANYNFERGQQQMRETDMDYDRYWQERVERSHGSNGRGF